jgi:hypothetical protein
MDGMEKRRRRRNNAQERRRRRDEMFWTTWDTKEDRKMARKLARWNRRREWLTGGGCLLVFYGCVLVSMLVLVITRGFVRP